jgi:transcriptional regulator with XRE-family HTH domain
MTAQPVGIHLRQWRQRRRLSQLDLASEAEISPRHLSFVETGRSTPSREMILHLAEQLEIPMRERNVLLVAAGYAPLFPERSLNDPALAAARAAIDLVLEAQKPYPAFAIDRHWNVVASNRALQEMYEGVDEALLRPPVNGMRLSLSPKGLAPRIENLAEWRGHLLARLQQQVGLTADPGLIALLAEVKAYPAPASDHRHAPDAMVVPFRLRIAAGTLSFFSTTMVFGTPVDVTLSELAVESFFPADAATAALVKKLSA